MTYKKGSWNIICDVCGFEFHADEVKHRWDGLIVCDADFETDHPQKHIRVFSDPKPVPFIRREPENNCVPMCTQFTKQAVAGVGVAGCMIAGQNNNLSYYDYVYTP